MNLPCPACRRHYLDPVQYNTVEIDTCRHCGGIWFDRGELLRACRHDDPNIPMTDEILASLGPHTGGASRPCPRCGGALFEYEHAPGSSVHIDVCGRCYGVWLDAGELAVIQKDQQVSRATATIDRPTNWKTWLFEFLLRLPVEFNVRPRKFPWITVLLIIANVLIWIGVVFGGGDVRKIFMTYGSVPATLGSSQWFVALFTSQFLHAGIVHLLANMYFLYILGDNVEDAMGKLGYLAFYLAMGAAGWIGHTIIDPSSTLPGVGASGAIAGVLGAYTIFFRRARLTLMLIVFQLKLSTFWYVTVYVVLNLTGYAMGAAGVAWMAHLAGFFSGLIFAAALYPSVAKRYPMLRLLNSA